MKKNYPVSITLIAFIAVFSLMLILLPKNEYSENEKRYLSEFPDFSWKGLTDGQYSKDIESYINDHFPLRDVFVGINSYYTLLSGRVGNGGVYLMKDGSLAAEPNAVDISKCEKNIGIIDRFSGKTEIKSYIMAVPSAGYMKSDLLPVYHKDYADKSILDMLSNCQNTQVIDLNEVFSDKDGIYYNTDHHVTGYGSYLMYLQYCKIAGIEPESFTKKESYGGFYGTNYSKSGLWLKNSDTIDVYKSDNGYSYKVTVDDITEKKESDSLYFYDHLENMDKYPLFLDGNHALTIIENQNVKNEKVLLIVKDSYAHCFSTFVCENYEKVIMVDLRYYRGAVSSLISEYNATELLYLFGTENLATMTDIAFLR